MDFPTDFGCFECVSLMLNLILILNLQMLFYQRRSPKAFLS
jgi:hypothetical protein